MFWSTALVPAYSNPPSVTVTVCVRPRHSRTRRAPGFRLRLGAGPTRPVVRKAFAIVCSLRRVALPSPQFLKSVTEGKDKQVATDPRRFTVAEPPPFAPQLLKAERPDAINLARDRLCVHRSHG
jgi:hypothetical protein